MPSTFKRFGISSGPSSSSNSKPSSSSSPSATSPTITSQPPAAYFAQSTSYSHDTEDEDFYSWKTPTKMNPSTPTQARHSRASSVASEASNGGFLNNLFSSAYSVNNASNVSFASSQGGSQTNSRPHTRQGSVSGNRRFSFFGLGGANNTVNASTNSLLAFSSASSTASVTSSRCCSRCSRAPSIAPLPSPLPPSMQTEDEFQDLDFASILNVPASPLSCTPAALKRLQEQSLEIIENLHRSYIARTEALKSAFAEIDALKEETEEKSLKIENLEQKVVIMTDVQDSLSKAAEEAEKVAKLTQDKLNEMIAEKNRKMSQSSIRMVHPSSKNGQEGYYCEEDDSLVSAQKFTKAYHQSNNSDSGFESDTDFSEGSPFSSKRTSFQGPPPSETIMKPAPTRFAVANEMTPPVSPMKPFPPQYQYSPQRGPVNNSRRMKSQSISQIRCDGSCNGGNSSSNESWTIMKLREENHELRSCIDACLEVVNGNF